MTLNQIIRRLRQICLAHKQVRNFYFGVPSNFLNDKTTVYASAFLQDVSGSLDISAKQRTMSFKLFLLDLVHVSADAKDNELDVQSDMLSVVEDLIAEINHSSYSDWKVSISNSVTIVSEEFEDMLAGAVIDFSIITPYTSDACAVPTESLPEIVNYDYMKHIYDLAYEASGSEGTTLTIPALAGKLIVLIIRENSPLHKVAVSPDEAEYIWNGTTITLGVATNADERFLILYRNL